MEIVNKIIGGVHSDNDPNQQPENTMRRSVDGVIMDVGDGNYVWETIKGTANSFFIPGGGSDIMGWCIIRERFILITLNYANQIVTIYEVTFSVQGTGTGTLEVLWSGVNSELNLHQDYPIRAMFGFYESQEIQRIYWTDDYNPPRVLNIGYEDPANKLVTIDEKFLPFSPVIDRAYGNFKLVDVLNGGYLRAGNYFVCWRYINNDYYSDWSYLTNPIQIAEGAIGPTNDIYQSFQGQAPDEITARAISFQLTNLDADYSNIQIAAFYSNDYNSAEPGIIFYDGELTGQTMDVIYYGNESAGSVTLEELLSVSIVIEKCKDMTTIQKRNIIGNIKTREELDVTGLNTANKNDRVDCSMEIITRDVILDVTGYESIPINGTSTIWGPGEKGLFKSPVGGTVTSLSVEMYCGIQYQGILPGGANLDSGGTFTWVADEIFTIPDTETVGATRTSGTCRPVIALKKYRKASAGPSPVWDDYEWKVTSLEGHYLDYKSPEISNAIRSLPGGETIRYGLVCFDLTGRPYFARWLNNTSAITGLGDLNIPIRTNTTGAGGLDLTRGYDSQSTADGIYFNQLNGSAAGVNIKELDLTDIINDISGFMIVRAPIVHQYLGSGLLPFTYHNAGGDEVYLSAGFREENSDLNKHEGTYGLHSPEDLFELKGFNIQAGDLIENIQYYYPYERSETETNGYGKGSTQRETLPSGNDAENAYQKMLQNAVSFSPGGSNAEIGVTHEVLYSTKFEIGDEDVAFDPRNESLLYKSRSAEYEGSARDGKNGKHNILILDIDESGNNPKGVFDSTEPIALKVAIKRPITSAYGGTSDSSLANTLYIACGHFQPITDAVRADIESGGRYVFNEIEIFGGDQYICLFGQQRLIVNRDGDYGSQRGHGIIFPVESRVNIGLREGTHLAKDRPYHNSTNTSGIRWEDGYYNLPEFNYNDGYSTDDIQDYYAPVPFNTTLISDFDTQVRHSPQKSLGERQDQFRVFNTLDKLELDSTFGELFNIKPKYNRIIYWQRDAVGYIPVNERALTQTAFGDPIQLGVGGIFERYDEMTDKIGNSNQFGLVESDVGFHWYDAKRKLYLTLTEALKFSQDSVAKGLNNWLEENVDYSILDHDIPVKWGGFGICGGYDPYHKIVFHTFFNPISGGSKTIGFDVRLQKFVGEYTMPGSWYMRYRNFMISVQQGSNQVYAHGFGSRARIYGAYLQPEIQIVIKSPTHEALLFDNFEIIGNDVFFDQITCENSDQLVVELIQDYLNGEYRFLGRNYEYRNRRWYGNFPKFQIASTEMVNRKERLLDGYMIVTFRALTTETKFMEMKTQVRKAY